ncbi:MAG: hypothetical protein JWO67_3308, partial [Streptosporangiaceae bacterium]|nr:hypothetical protein [Streptosporangiaceae bacterium]
MIDQLVDLALTDSDLDLIQSEYKQLLIKKLARELFEAEQAADDEAAASWDGVDLTPYLDGSLPEVHPTALLRSDDKGLFYSGYNTLFGDSTAGKSLICAEAARQQITAGKVVLWVEFEEADPREITARLLSMGLTPHQIKAHLHFVRPDSGTSPASLRRAAAGALKLCGDQGAERVGLVVVDSVGESLGLEGLSMDKDADFGPWATRIKTFVREFPQAAVVVIDHGKKGNDDTSKFFPSGTFRKIATVTGAAWLAETVQPFNKDHAGSVRLLCAKDRHGGYLRKDVGAVIHVTPKALAGPNGHLVVDVRSPGPTAAAGSAGTADWEAVSKVAETMEKAPHPLSKNQIETNTRG